MGKPRLTRGLGARVLCTARVGASPPFAMPGATSQFYSQYVEYFGPHFGNFSIGALHRI